MIEIPKVNLELMEKAEKHVDNLTKPPKSLGYLEKIAKKLYCIFDGNMPREFNKRLYVIAGDHGVVKRGVSAFPQEVTPQMVFNFVNGGAAINVFARHGDIEIRVVDAGVNYDFPDNLPIIHHKIDYGTKDFTVEPAMTIEQCEKAIENGIALADIANNNKINLLSGGEMGIGNTTPSAALICAFLYLEPEKIVGYGTGIDDERRKNKVNAVSEGIKRIKDESDPINILANLGGFEIAELTGLILGSAKHKIPFVVDGFISTAAAISAIKINPNVKDYLFFGHVSEEKGHKTVLDILNVRPILNLNLRLGEGTGAALSMHIIEAALKMFNEMATFESAGVSEKEL